MKINQLKINELAESWINGNISYVKDKVKRLNKLEFLLLAYEIHNRTDNRDLDEIAYRLTN